MPEPMIGTYYAGGVKRVNPENPHKKVLGAILIC